MGKAVFGRTLSGQIADRSWVILGRCMNDPKLPEDFFFPKRKDEEGLARAVAYCEACSVRSACLQYALTEVDEGKSDKMVNGVFGGKTAPERVAIRKANK